MHVDRRSFVRRLAGALPSGDPDSSRAAGAGRPETAAECGRSGCGSGARGRLPQSVYPDDIDGALADQLGRLPGFVVTRGRLTDPQAGLSDAGPRRHRRAHLVGPSPARRRARRSGRGRRPAGARGPARLHRPLCVVRQQAVQADDEHALRAGQLAGGRPARVRRVKSPDHPIAQGIAPFTIPKTDMFSEPFAVPSPETVVFVSTWEKGETLRSGLTWTIGKGRVAYLRTGPEGYPGALPPLDPPGHRQQRPLGRPPYLSRLIDRIHVSRITVPKPRVVRRRTRGRRLTPRRNRPIIEPESLIA